MKPRRSWLAAVLCAVLVAGCDDNGGGASVAWNTFWDLVWGEPDAEALVASARFEGGGIAFDYPAVLRLRERVDADDGDRSWSFEHGMFELELYAPKAEVTAADYLGTLAEMFQGGRSTDAKGLASGSPTMLCGQALAATRLRLKIMGDWSEIEAYDLPAPAGESRILSFDDEPVEGKPSAVARATRERVLASLRCDIAS